MTMLSRACVSPY